MSDAGEAQRAEEQAFADYCRRTYDPQVAETMITAGPAWTMWHDCWQACLAHVAERLEAPADHFLVDTDGLAKAREALVTAQQRQIEACAASGCMCDLAEWHHWTVYEEALHDLAYATHRTLRPEGEDR